MTSAYATRLTPSGATVLAATGKLNFHAADALRQQLLDLIKSGAIHVVVDLSDVQSMDSSGVAALVSGWKVARSCGGDLRLAAPIRSVAGVLEMTNLDKVLTVHPSSEVAFLDPA